MADVSFVPYFGPILAYFLVALVIGAILSTINIFGKNKWLAVFLALIIATIFVAAGGLVDYVLVVTPWIVALVISLFFILMITGFLGIKGDAKMMKRVGVGVVVLAGLIFLASAFVIYSSAVSPYLPFSDQYIGNGFTDWLYSPRIVGAIMLLVVAALASWVLMKS